MDGTTVYVNPAVGVVVSDRDVLCKVYGPITGGLLSDEMGLGKTLSLIATACLNQRGDINLEPPIGRLPRSGATLIITPPTILQQWQEEIAEHAPSLKVIHYDGMKGSKQKLGEIVEKLAESDVVLTTYSVISREGTLRGREARPELAQSTKTRASKEPFD